MINVKVFKQMLERYMTNEQIKSFMDTVITKSGSNYNLFGTYDIDSCGELFEVNKLGTFTSHSFGSLRVAVAWCIMDRRNKVIEGNSILFLDSQISSLSAEIRQQSKLREAATELSGYILHDSKLDIIWSKRKALLDQLDSLVEESKIWQETKFEQHKSNLSFTK